jgi:hypothetical protein
MSQLRPYEGPNAERLVEQVRRELGPDAKIVRGETHRTGGVLGFFSKEQLRLYAEVPEDGELPRPAQLPEAAALPRHAQLPGRMPDPLTVDVFATLADETADRNDVTSTPPAPWDSNPSRGRARRETMASRPAARREADAPSLALVKPELDRPAEPDDFEAVLRDVAGAIDTQPAPSVAPTGLHFRDDRRAPTVAPLAAAAPPTGPPEPTPVPAHRLAAPPPEPAAGPPTPTATTRPEAAPIPPAGPPAATRPDAAPLSSSSAPERPHSDRMPRHTAGAGDLAVTLRAAGLRREDAEATAQLVEAGVDLSVVLTQLFVVLAPAPPPLHPALPHRLVIVGTADQTGRLAADLSAACDLPSDAIACADTMSLDERDRAVILTVDAPVTTPRLARQRRAIAALRPATVIGIVDAVVKAEDIVAWADGLGGVDALALAGVHTTHSPAAVLRTGIPVARLDGHPASPARWAATVADLVEAGR